MGLGKLTRSTRCTTMPLIIMRMLHFLSKGLCFILRPQDSRMWNAMGGCYEKMEKNHEAAKCYEKAERHCDKEGIALHKLAKLYVLMERFDSAAFCFKENLKRKDLEEVEGSETIEALMFLAKFCKQKGKLDEATSYARRLHDYSGPEREEASALIREINA